MAKAKRRLKKRINTMATRRKKRRRTTRSLSTHRRTTARRHTPRKTTRRRKRKGMLHDSAAKPTLKKSFMIAGAGGLGGAVYTLPRFMFTMPWYAKLGWGLVSSIGLSMLKFEKAGAGAAGAFVNDLAQTSFGLADENLNNTQFVDPDTLQDTGMIDDGGNAVVMDDDGVLYALNDGGDYEAIGDIYSLQEGTNMPDVSMLPLQDSYALNSGYALQ